MGLEICKKCGRFHYVPGPCPTERAEVRNVRSNELSDSSRKSAKGGRASLAKERSESSTTTTADAQTAVAINGEPRKSNFDRVAYQRDYMRKRRAKAKDPK